MAQSATTDLEHLANALNSRDEEVRERAFQEALALPAETLLPLLMSEAKRVRIDENMEGLLGAFGCAWLLACVLTVVMQFAFHTAFVLWDVLLFLWLPLVIGFGHKIEVRSRRYSRFSRLILARNDVRFVAPALLFYPGLDSRAYPDLYAEMRRSLLHLLPLLTPADREAWTSAHKAALRQQAFGNGNEIGCWHDLAMLRCVLQTLTRVGDAADIPPTRKLAGLRPKQIAAHIRPYVLDEDRRELRAHILASTVLDPKRHGQLDPENEAVLQDARYHQWCLERAQEIHALANECLYVLEERSGQQQADVLLRASGQADVNQSSLLLHPQYNVEPGTSPEQLLRPNKG